LKVILIAICILFAGATVGAQQAQSKPEPPLSQNGTVVGDFDRFEGQSIIEIRNMVVSDTVEGGTAKLMLNARGKYTDSPKLPAQIS
jgi:hypothetical protein